MLLLLDDMAKRKLNVVVTGLPEATNSTTTSELKFTDERDFLQLCEEHLPVKPTVAPNGCVRLGQPDGQRPRKLLVRLMSESCTVTVS